MSGDSAPSSATVASLPSVCLVEPAEAELESGVVTGVVEAGVEEERRCDSTRCDSTAMAEAEEVEAQEEERRCGRLGLA